MTSFIADTLWAWFISWPLPAHIALGAGVFLFLWGTLAGLYSFASKLGGWKAGVGALLALAAVAGALWPRKVGTDEQYPHPDPVIAKPKKKRPTIFNRKRPF